MSAPAITPGPWEVREHRTSLGVNGGPDGLNIATVTLGYNRDVRYAEKAANAKAIAAVPAMIAALQKASPLVEGECVPGFNGDWEQALASIGEALQLAGIPLDEPL
jgi:predicted metal-dependent phosphoesterase TrpH